MGDRERAAPDRIEPNEWNQRCRDLVDRLLAEAGYADDSSARHSLALMNFDAPAAQDADAPDQPAEVREVVAKAIEPITIAPNINAGRVLAALAAAGYRITRDAPTRPTVGETWETPEGAVMVVPVEPVEVQIDEGERVTELAYDDSATAIYRAMLAAVAKETTR